MTKEEFIQEYRNIAYSMLGFPLHEETSHTLESKINTLLIKAYEEKNFYEHYRVQVTQDRYHPSSCLITFIDMQDKAVEPYEIKFYTNGMALYETMDKILEEINNYETRELQEDIQDKLSS